MRRLSALLLLVFLPAAVSASSWALDPETTVAVDVPWQGSSVTVRFPAPTGSVDFDPDDPASARASVTVSSRDASTGVGVVDALVKSDGYLAADRFPEMTFSLDRLTPTSRKSAKVDGRLTLRGVTLPVRFDATVTRYGPDPGRAGRFEAGFDLAGEIDRTAFGSTGGIPEVPALLPVRIRLLMHSD